VFRQLSEIVERNLPADGYISHDGYRVIARAALARYRKDITIDLIAAARAIPNMADRSLVLFYSALSQPKLGKSMQESLIREASEMAKNIPMAGDRLERFISFAQASRNINERLTREMLLEAVRMLPAEEHGGQNRVRHIIDLAYKVDKEFASELTDKLDDDRAKRHARQQIEILDLKQSLIDETALTQRVQSTPHAEYRRLGSMLLGSLQSGRMDSIRSLQQDRA
jgi:hypothetical protein